MSELESPVPSVVVLEDLHWADEATLDVVRLVGRRVRAIPILLVVSYRDELVHRSHPLRLVLGELAGAGPVRRLELRGLSRDAVATLAGSSSVDPDVLYDRTGGNPFFVTEALAAETDGVPSTVRDAVLARAARLSAPAAGRAGRGRHRPAARRGVAARGASGSALGALDECLRSGMLARGPRAAWPSATSWRAWRSRSRCRRTAPSLLTDAPSPRWPTRRRRAPDLARLAHHAEAAGDGPAVLRYAPAAAERAAAVGAPRRPRTSTRGRCASPRLAPERRADAARALRRRGLSVRHARGGGAGAHARPSPFTALAETCCGRARCCASAPGCSPACGRTAGARTDAVEAIALLEQCHRGPSSRAPTVPSRIASMLAEDVEGTIAVGPARDRAGRTRRRHRGPRQRAQQCRQRRAEPRPRGGRDKLERSLALARQAGLGRRRRTRLHQPRGGPEADATSGRRRSVISIPASSTAASTVSRRG